MQSTIILIHAGWSPGTSSQSPRRIWRRRSCCWCTVFDYHVIVIDWNLSSLLFLNSSRSHEIWDDNYLAGAHMGWCMCGCRFVYATPNPHQLTCMAADSIQPNRFCGGTFHGGRNKITHRPQLPRTGFTARNTPISWLRPSPLKVETFRWLCGFPIQVVIEHNRIIITWFWKVKWLRPLCRYCLIFIYLTICRQMFFRRYKIIPVFLQNTSNDHPPPWKECNEPINL